MFLEPIFPTNSFIIHSVQDAILNFVSVYNVVVLPYKA